MVSVYCLAYNHEKYIRNCLDGFIRQKTDFRYEVIIHDDASQDKTALIIKEYAEKYPDIIKPIYQVNNQYSQNVDIISTFIIPKLLGKYTAVCEGDDYWSDVNKLQRQVDFLESHDNYVACVHQTECINCLNGKRCDTSPLTKSGTIDKTLILTRDSPMYHTSSLMYRGYINSKLPYFFYMSKNVKDYPLGIFLALCGEIYFMNESMSVYRLYTETSWSLNNKKKHNIVAFANNMICMLEEVDKYTEHKYSELLYKPMLEFKYKSWKYCPQIRMYEDKSFNKLGYKRKVKLFFRMLIHTFFGKRGY